MVIDTMVFAYALLGVTNLRGEAAAALGAVDEVAAPDLVRAELSNAVTQWIREEGVDFATGIGVLRDADALITRMVPTNVVWERAVELAVRGPHATYDTLFIAAAELLGTKVLTYDKQMLRRFPQFAILPSAILG